MTETFSEEERHVVYRVIRARRDIRHFSSRPLEAGVILRLLKAAHQAPSVGLMQPWNFILITSVELRQQVKRSFAQINAHEQDKMASGERLELYRSLKLEGILEAPLNIAVTCDLRRDAPFVLGRDPMPDTPLFSTCLAIENLWLAARAEGVGVGWVSLLDHPAVETLLQLPPAVRLVAYLCVGYPCAFSSTPLLEEVGWKARGRLAPLVYHDVWNQPSTIFAQQEDGTDPPSR